MDDFLLLALPRVPPTVQRHRLLQEAEGLRCLVGSKSPIQKKPAVAPGAVMPAQLPRDLAPEAEPLHAHLCHPLDSGREPVAVLLCVEEACRHKQGTCCRWLKSPHRVQGPGPCLDCSVCCVWLGGSTQRPLVMSCSAV